MANIFYKTHKGETLEIDAKPGDSVMYTALAKRVQGILGECGGSLACATCHVYVDPEWLQKLPPMSELENEMLDATACERQANSRLCCQIEISDELHGLTVTIPETQL